MDASSSIKIFLSRLSLSRQITIELTLNCSIYLTIVLYLWLIKTPWRFDFLPLNTRPAQGLSNRRLRFRTETVRIYPNQNRWFLNCGLVQVQKISNRNCAQTLKNRRKTVKPSRNRKRPTVRNREKS